MRWPFTDPPFSLSPVQELLERYLEQPFPTTDHVLLCCFGPDHAGERTHHQLRQALLEAGFTGPLIRHILTTSPIIVRTENRCYRLQPFQE